MSQICTLSHSATTDTAAPHPLTTECMGYETKKWEMRLSRVTAERDEALDRIERLNERIDHSAKKSNDWQDVSGLLNDQLSSALGKIERAKARLESGITHGFEIGHCSECDEIGWLLAFLKGDTE